MAKEEGEIMFEEGHSFVPEPLTGGAVKNVGTGADAAAVTTHKKVLSVLRDNTPDPREQEARVETEVGQEKPPLQEVMAEIFLDEKRRENEEAMKRIDAELAELFPESTPLFRVDRIYQAYHDRITSRIAKLPPERQEKGKILLRLCNEKNYTCALYFGYKDRGNELFTIASLLRGQAINPKNALQEVKETVKGKKILVIGDDVGSLSEVLNTLGATAYGVEYSKDKVTVAHSGILAEDLQPQSQVMQGDAWDFLDPESELSQKVRQLGPFDLIFSHEVINGGSGFMEGMQYRADKQTAESTTRVVNRELARFSAKLDRLLTKDGMQIHTYAFDLDIGIGVQLRKQEEKAKDTEDKQEREIILQEVKAIEEDMGTGGYHNVVAVRSGSLQKLEKYLPKSAI